MRDFVLQTGSARAHLSTAEASLCDDRRGEAAGVSSFARSRSELLLALGLVAIVQGVLFAQIHDYALMGWDTHPLIASARIESWADLVANFTLESPKSSHSFSFYRPVMNLSLAVDHALFGLEPFGYHATDALLAGACALALFGLTRRLLGPGARVGPWIALITFLLLPVHAEVLPLVSRRMDVLCALFVALALTAQASRMDDPFSPRSAWPALLTMLAVGANQTGLVAAPLIVALALLSGPAASARAQLGRAARTALPHFVAAALVFAARSAALGQLVGHDTPPLAHAITKLPWSTGLLSVRLSSLFENADVPIRTQWIPVLGATLLWIVVLLWIIALVRRGTATSGGDALPAATIPATAATGLLACTWITLVACVHGVNGFIQSWDLLIPGQAFALGLGALAEELHAGLRARPRPLTALGVGVLVVVIGLQARWSPLLHDYGHWKLGHVAVERYLADLARTIEAADDGEVVTVLAPPISRRAGRNTLGATRARLLHVYSLPSWAELRFPDQRVEFRHRRLGNPSSEPLQDGVVVLVEGRVRARARAARIE